MKVRTALRWGSLILAAGIVLSWILLGANRGWTRTSVAIPKKDPVTDQDYFEWQKKFVPGVEILGAGLLITAALFGVSFIKIKNKNVPRN